MYLCFACPVAFAESAGSTTQPPIPPHAKRPVFPTQALDRTQIIKSSVGNIDQVAKSTDGPGLITNSSVCDEKVLDTDISSIFFVTSSTLNPVDRKNVIF